MHESELQTVTDEAVNSAYNYFDAERMKYYHGVYVKTNRSFMRKKTSDTAEWENFASVIRLCKKNNFHLRCYIKYCFLNCLVPKAKGKTLADIIYLRNYPQVIKYARNKSEIEKLYNIYMSIMKTVLSVKNLSRKNGENVKSVIKNIIKSGKLSEYVSTGIVSPYFLSLIHNVNVIINRTADKNTDDMTVINDLCSRMNVLGESAVKAMSMFYPTAMNKTIVEICSE